MRMGAHPPICPVFINIGSSRAVTLPCFFGTLYPSIQTEARRIARQRGFGEGPRECNAASSLPAVGTGSMPVDVRLRPCGLSQHKPCLQHESWKCIWETYIAAVRERGEVSAPGVAPIAQSGTATSTCGFPLAGTRTLPVSLADTTTQCGEGVKETTMEFFRVDDFIPVHVQMLYLVRRLLGSCDDSPLSVVAIGVVAPTHEVSYFESALSDVRDGTKSAVDRCVPSVLVYSPEGLKLRIS
ncbi:hypothetical protein TRVL_01869 [Trypanosoma vivax]|nr:hypothetical protein TRVL_01869 [Trypanosoma vivax]